MLRTGCDLRCTGGVRASNPKSVVIGDFWEEHIVFGSFKSYNIGATLNTHTCVHLFLRVHLGSVGENSGL